MGLGAFGNADTLLAVNGRHGYLPAERRSDEADRNLAVEVIVAALEHGMRLDENHDVEVARLAAARAGVAFSRNPNSGPAVHSGRNPDRALARLTHSARAVALRARRAYNAPLSSAAPADCLSLKGAEQSVLDVAYVSGPSTGLARIHFGAGGRAGSVAEIAGFQ